MTKKAIRKLLENIAPAAEKPGNIYAARNEFLPGLVKIGMTRNGVSRRLTNLSCSLPADFELICETFVHNPEGVESALHIYFRDERVKPNREFFRVSEEKVLAAFEVVNEMASVDMAALMSKVFAR